MKQVKWLYVDNVQWLWWRPIPAEKGENICDRVKTLLQVLCGSHSWDDRREPFYNANGSIMQTPYIPTLQQDNASFQQEASLKPWSWKLLNMGRSLYPWRNHINLRGHHNEIGFSPYRRGCMIQGLNADSDMTEVLSWIWLEANLAGVFLL